MILVTGGCSFSECNSGFKETWPTQLEKQINPIQSYHDGLHCQGNGLISRKVIYRLSELLKTNKKEDLLVGLMWSSHLRHDFFHSNIKFQSNVDNWLHNPTGFVPVRAPVLHEHVRWSVLLPCIVQSLLIQLHLIVVPKRIFDVPVYHFGLRENYLVPFRHKMFRPHKLALRPYAISS